MQLKRRILSSLDVSGELKVQHSFLSICNVIVKIFITNNSMSSEEFKTENRLQKGDM